MVLCKHEHLEIFSTCMGYGVRCASCDCLLSVCGTIFEAELMALNKMKGMNNMVKKVSVKTKKGMTDYILEGILARQNERGMKVLSKKQNDIRMKTILKSLREGKLEDSAGKIDIITIPTTPVAFAKWYVVHRQVLSRVKGIGQAAVDILGYTYLAIAKEHEVDGSIAKAKE